jgi:hypothetical protein
MTDTLETAVLLTLGTHKRGSTNRRFPRRPLIPFPINIEDSTKANAS